MLAACKSTLAAPQAADTPSWAECRSSLVEPRVERRHLPAGARVERKRRAATAALAVPCNLAVSKGSAAVAAGMGLFVAFAVRMDWPVAGVASTEMAAGRMSTEAVAPAASPATAAMGCTPSGRIDSRCSWGCKQLVWERSSESAA